MGYVELLKGSWNVAPGELLGSPWELLGLLKALEGSWRPLVAKLSVFIDWDWVSVGFSDPRQVPEHYRERGEGEEGSSSTNHCNLI